jgi:hypothetical protein
MTESLNRDYGFRYAKRGRLLRDEEQAAVIEARARELLSLHGGGTPSRRVTEPMLAAASRGSAAAPGPAGRSRSSETVLKVIGWSKAGGSALNQARYISRTRDIDIAAGQQPVPIENERGETIDGPALKAEIASWGLLKDSENRSAKWKAATPEERAAMSQADALSRRQSAHIMFSLPKGSVHDAEVLRSVVAQAASETFHEAGFRYVFAVHTDHSDRPHAHIVIAAKSEPDEAGRRRTLRLGPTELDHLRQVFTRHAQEHGLPVTATRRIDRPELREKIQFGETPLRENVKIGTIYNRLADPHPSRPKSPSRDKSRALKAFMPDQGSVFQAKAPAWYEVHGLAYERRRLAAYDQAHSGELPSAKRQERRGLLHRLTRALGFAKTPTPAAPNRPETPALKRLDRHFQQTHRDPIAARESFIAMYREAPRLAVWAANNHPQAFGETTGRKSPTRLTGRGMGQLLAAGERAGRPLVPAPTPDQRQERARLQEQVRRAKADRRRTTDAAAVPTQLNRLAQTVERTTGNRDLAARVREVAQAKPRQPADLEKLRQYQDLERRLRQRDAIERGRTPKQDRGRRGPDR